MSPNLSGAEYGWREQLGTYASEVYDLPVTSALTAPNPKSVGNSSNNSERKLQRNFLKKHGLKLSGKLRKQHRFLRNMKDDDDEEGDDMSSRSRRSPDRKTTFVIQDSPEISVMLDQSAGTPAVDDVLEEIAEEEINEVDIIMEDISDEIKDLQVRTRRILNDQYPFFCVFVSTRKLFFDCSDYLLEVPDGLPNCLNCEERFALICFFTSNKYLSSSKRAYFSSSELFDIK